MNGNNHTDLPDFDTMTPAQFEAYLPDYFSSQTSGANVDPSLQRFLDRNPDCAALVRDLEAIADAAKSLLPIEEPSDTVWLKIQEEMGTLGKPATPAPEID